MPSGVPSHVLGDLDVLALLARRRAAGSVPGARLDAHRVALVLGGGGMRGSYTAGMARGLERAGLRDAFDDVYGSSSGSFAGAALLTGQAGATAAAYPEDLASRAFIDLRRLATRRPVLSLEHLMVEVLGRRKPLRWSALSDGAIRLRFVATDTADLTPHSLGPELGRRWTGEQWQRAAWASATVPLLAGPPREVDGRRWIDGSVSEPLAVARAVRDGATHVLALLCRGSADLHPDPSAGRSWWATLLDRLVPGLGTLAQGSRRYRRDLDVVTEAGHPDRGRARLLAVAPAATAGVTSLGTDRPAVARAVEIGDRTVTAVLDGFGGPGPTR